METRNEGEGDQKVMLWVKIYIYIYISKSKGCVSRESNAGPIDGNDGFYH